MDIEKKLLKEVLTNINTSTVFRQLSSHALETSDGVDSHYITLVHLICRKYLFLRLKKVLKDVANQRRVGKDDHALQQSRVVQNL